MLKLEKQKREQQLRKEAYLALIEDSTKQKKKEQIELIDQLVRILYYLVDEYITALES